MAREMRMKNIFKHIAKKISAMSNKNLLVSELRMTCQGVANAWHTIQTTITRDAF